MAALPVGVWPERLAAALKSVARAKPGGVLIHCVRGHDRTAIVSMLLLTLAGVAPEEILADYQLSIDPEREEILARVNTSARDVILSVIASLDIESYLHSGGLARSEMSALRGRLLEP